MTTALFIFRRDLRLEDNTGLIYASTHFNHIIPLFNFSPIQVENNPYKSLPAIQFMLNSLTELNEAIRQSGGQLIVSYNTIEETLTQIFKELTIDAVIVNRDYTPFSQKRDQSLKSLCHIKGIPFISCHDLLLNEPETIHKNDGTPYTVFTPFMKKSRLNPIKYPNQYKIRNFISIDYSKQHSLTSIQEKVLPNPSQQLLLKGGRQEALKLLNQTPFQSYHIDRNIPAKKGTSLLAAHLKFGTLSVREVLAQVQNITQELTFTNELYWRDFFTHIGWHFPYVFGHCFRKVYDTIKWSNNKEYFQRWCDGKTGFPIVDAGMRQLNQSGWMHNRVRMIVASFLVKDLHIDWRWGEKYFAQKLIDYDPAINNGNWQWAASTGCDAQPYFRIFNPWSQQKKFDPDALYIKKWIPELYSLNSKEIHQLEHTNSCPDYPFAIVNHAIERQITLELFKAAKA